MGKLSKPIPLFFTTLPGSFELDNNGAVKYSLIVVAEPNQVYSGLYEGNKRSGSKLSVSSGDGCIHFMRAVGNLIEVHGDVLPKIYEMEFSQIIFFKSRKTHDWNKWQSDGVQFGTHRFYKTTGRTGRNNRICTRYDTEDSSNLLNKMVSNT